MLRRLAVAALAITVALPVLAARRRAVDPPRLDSRPSSGSRLPPRPSPRPAPAAGSMTSRRSLPSSATRASSPSWAPKAAALLKLAQRLWSIGSLWDPANILSRHRWDVPLADAFDVMIYIETTTASKLNRR